MKMNHENAPDIIPTLELQKININTEPGVYRIEGFGFAVVEQIEYPHERTNLRLVIDVEILQRLEMQLQNAKKEADYYIDQTIKLRGQLNHENGNYEVDHNGLPRFGNPSDGK